MLMIKHIEQLENFNTKTRISHGNLKEKKVTCNDMEYVVGNDTYSTDQNLLGGGILSLCINSFYH